MTSHVERAAAAAREFSDLVAEVERTNTEGARLLIGGMSSACWSWQTDRFTRTEQLDEVLKRLHAVIDSAPGKEPGSLMLAALGNVRSKAATLLGDMA